MMHTSRAAQQLFHSPQPVPQGAWLRAPQPRHPVHSNPQAGPDGPYARCLRAPYFGDGAPQQAPRPCHQPPLDEWRHYPSAAAAQCHQQAAGVPLPPWIGQSPSALHHRHTRGPLHLGTQCHSPNCVPPPPEPMIELIAPMPCLPGSPASAPMPAIASAHFHAPPPSMVHGAYDATLPSEGVAIMPPSRGLGFLPQAVNLPVPPPPPCIVTNAVVH